jgi:hypothetical protein
MSISGNCGLSQLAGLQGGMEAFPQSYSPLDTDFVLLALAQEWYS